MRWSPCTMHLCQLPVGVPCTNFHAIQLRHWLSTKDSCSLFFVSIYLKLDLTYILLYITIFDFELMMKNHEKSWLIILRRRYCSHFSQQLRYSWITLSDLSDMAYPRHSTPRRPPVGMGVVRTRQDEEPQLWTNWMFGLIMFHYYRWLHSLYIWLPGSPTIHIMYYITENQNININIL